MNDLEVIELLDRAVASDLGLSVKCADPDAVRRRLYVVMRKCRDLGNLKYDGLTLRIAKKDEVYLVKKVEDNAEAGS